nr:hypothetical protein [Tanacetum cinerariifolium]
NWHYVRDDVLFSTIKVVSRHQTTQQYGAILPIELTTDEIRNSKAYKEYYACAMREAAPKPKASTRKKKGNKSDESDDERDEGSDDDSDETVKAGASKDDDDNDDEDNDDNDEEEELAKSDEE